MSKIRLRHSLFLLAVALVAVAFGCSDFASNPFGTEATSRHSGKAAPAPDQTQTAVHRPLSDFLSAQGSTNIFVPPVPDFFGFGSALNISPVRFASVDYAGLAATWLANNGGPSLGTTVDGSVRERALADGRAEVTVILRIRNALTWAFTFDPNGPGDQFATAPLLFGYRAQDLAANPALTPALGNAHMQVVFINSAPGDPLPDLLYMGSVPGQEFVSIYFNSNSTGPLRALAGVAEGTPGRCIVIQSGVLFRAHFNGATGDGFPAEKVELRALRGGPNGQL